MHHCHGSSSSRRKQRTGWIWQRRRDAGTHEADGRRPRLSRQLPRAVPDDSVQNWLNTRHPPDRPGRVGPDGAVWSDTRSLERSPCQQQTHRRRSAPHAGLQLINANTAASRPRPNTSSTRRALRQSETRPPPPLYTSRPWPLTF